MAEKYDLIPDSIELMRQLAKLAGIPEGGFRRMVLVLDIDSIPVLYTDGIILKPKDVPLKLEVPEGPLKHEHKRVDVQMSAGLSVQQEIGDSLREIGDTTTQQNERYRTKVPLAQQEMMDCNQKPSNEALQKAYDEYVKRAHSSDKAPYWKQ